jgi:nucleotide-binding universal stress UspA family protein
MADSSSLKRILLATERTGFDAGAEQLAIELAGRAKLELHVVMPLIGNAEYQIVAPERVAAAESQARQALAALAAQATEHGVTLSAHVREGDELWREIVDESRERHADLLVIRRVGRRGMLARLMVGEMVSQVAAHATMPVLMAASSSLWSRRVLAVLAPHADVAATIQIAARLAALVHVPLQAVCLTAAGAAVDIVQTMAYAAAIAGEQGVAVESPAETGTLAAFTADRVRTAQADLLVLGLGAAERAHGRLGSAVQALVGAVTCPTVVVGANSPRA